MTYPETSSDKENKIIFMKSSMTKKNSMKDKIHDNPNVIYFLFEE
jgi:hypothetical protein